MDNVDQNRLAEQLALAIGVTRLLHPTVSALTRALKALDPEHIRREQQGLAREELARCFRLVAEFTLQIRTITERIRALS